MKKLILFLVSLFSSLAYSQEIDIRWSEEYDVTRRSRPINYIHNQNGLSVIFNNNKENRLFVKQYDDELKLKGETDLNLDIDNGNYQILDPLTGHDDIKFFFKERIKKDDKTVLYASIIDKNNVAGKVKIIDEVNDDKPKYFGITSLSFDKNSVGITKRNFDRDKEKNKIYNYSVKVFDKNLDFLKFEKSFDIPFDSQLEEVAFEVDNNGNCYLLIKQFRSRKNKERGDSSFYYELYSINSKTNDIKVFEFNLEDHYINSLSMHKIDNDKIVVAGFARNLSKSQLLNKNNTDSFSFLSSLINTKNVEINKPTVVELGAIYPEKIKRLDRIPYLVRDILYREDGSYNIIAEQYFLRVQTVCDRYGCQTYYTYYYNDILSLLFNKNQQLQNLTRIPKYQVNLEFSSIVNTTVGNKTYIIYEDKSEIAETIVDVPHKNKSIPKNRKKNALQMVVITENGETIKRKIYDNKDMDKKDLINVHKSIKTESGKIITLGNKRIGLIDIKK